MIAVRYIPFLCVPLIVEAVIPHSANGQGNEVATSELPSSHSDFTVTATASLAETVGAARKLFVDLGTLKSGAQGVATIEIDNPFDEPIPITAARASCACAQSKLLTNVIPSKGSAPLQVLLSIPDHAASASFNGTIELQVDRENCRIPGLRLIVVSISYSVKGMLSFTESYMTLGVHPNYSREIKIPFVHSLDSPVERLDVRTTGFLQGVSGEIIGGDPLSHVKVVLRSRDALPEGAHGTITLSAGAVGPSDTVDVVLFLEDDIRISPRTLRFKASDDSLVANAILHFSDLDNVPSKRPTSELNRSAPDIPAGPKSVFCEAFVHGKPLAVEQHRLSRLVYRVKLRFDGNAGELESLALNSDEKNSVRWSIVTDRQKRTLDSQFIVSQEKVDD